MTTPGAYACSSQDQLSGVMAKCLPPNPNNGPASTVVPTAKVQFGSKLEEVTNEDLDVQGALEKREVQYMFKTLREETNGPIRYVKIIRTRSDQPGARTEIQFLAESKEFPDSLRVFGFEKDSESKDWYRLSGPSIENKEKMEQFYTRIKSGDL
jgi:hypothetical protein